MNKNELKACPVCKGVWLEQYNYNKRTICSEVYEGFPTYGLKKVKCNQCKGELKNALYIKELKFKSNQSKENC
jgi:Zn-finger nucleic acid-binding protein